MHIDLEFDSIEIRKDENDGQFKFFFLHKGEILLDFPIDSSTIIPDHLQLVLDELQCTIQVEVNF